MNIHEIKLRNFRNYNTLELKISNNTNILVGENAQGKTSLIEAIFASSTTKSHRTSKDEQLIKIGEDFSKIQIECLTHDNENKTLDLILSKKGKKASINGVNYKLLSDYIGKLKVVFFSPEDIMIIKGAPGIRRRYLNMSIGQLDSQYIYHLNAYNKILKQRNHLLKSFVQSDNNQLLLEVITEQLIQHQLYVFQKREWFLKLLESFVIPVHQHMTQNTETITLNYEASFKEDVLTEDECLKQYQLAMASDIRLKTTTIGIHRDDFSINISNLDVANFGSQGQQRTAILSMKLAEVELIKDLTEIYPILLLDDVLSELDINRQSQLLIGHNREIQTFITTTSLVGISDKILNNAEIFNVNGGKIE